MSPLLLLKVPVGFLWMSGKCFGCDMTIKTKRCGYSKSFLVFLLVSFRVSFGVENDAWCAFSLAMLNANCLAITVASKFKVLYLKVYGVFCLKNLDRETDRTKKYFSTLMICVTNLEDMIVQYKSYEKKRWRKILDYEKKTGRWSERC